MLLFPLSCTFLSLSLSLSLFRYLVQSLFMSFASIFSSRIVPDLIFIEFFDSVPSLRQTFSRNISAPNNISRFFQKHSTIIFSHVPAIYNSFVRCEFYTRQKKKKIRTSNTRTSLRNSNEISIFYYLYRIIFSSFHRSSLREIHFLIQLSEYYSRKSTRIIVPHCDLASVQHPMNKTKIT